MGAWGTGSFDNDDACDWSYGLEEVDDLSLVTDTLAEVLETADELVEANLGCEALAACEVLARLKGNWGPQNAYTEPVDQWVKAHPFAVPPGVIESAVSVINRILAPQSELFDLWEEAGDVEWRQSVEDLLTRLRS